MYVGSGGLILTLLLFLLSAWGHPQQAVVLGPQGPSSLWPAQSSSSRMCAHDSVNG